MEMNTVIAENADHIHPTYDTTVEVDVRTISNRYSKLERKEMYVKVTLGTFFLFIFRFGFKFSISPSTPFDVLKLK